MSTVPETASIDQLCEELYGSTTAQSAREAWAHAVHTVAAKAKETLPESHTRIDKAAKLVLNDAVELLDGNKARVASQGKDGVQYHITNGQCDCEDYEYRAPQGWCKHKLAKALYLRAARMIEATTAAMDAVPATPVETPMAEPVASAAAENMALPEAPASVNVRVTIAGRDAQITLRDSDEARLLLRLESLLARYPVDAPAIPAVPQEGWCGVHSIQMRHNTRAGQSWWSHKLQDGAWCKGR